MAHISLLHPVGHTARVTQYFGVNPQIYKKFRLAGHNGLDYGVSIGTRVKAAEKGRVNKTGFDSAGYGNYIKLDHDNGRYQTLYAHLSSYAVNTGQTVERGEIIGYTGNTGFSTGPHLHFELRIPSQKIPGYPNGEQNPLPHFAAVGPEPDPIVIVPPGYVRVTAPAGLHVRTEPRMTGTIVGTAPYGTAMKKDGVVGEWVAVIVYVHNSWVK